MCIQSSANSCMQGGSSRKQKVNASGHTKRHFNTHMQAVPHGMRCMMYILVHSYGTLHRTVAGKLRRRFYFSMALAYSSFSVHIVL
mmetsp:Transcript_31572/g.58887  ORF Transcript_31572/g.58887 Transcript_31572/m.58887 type:complete len:86 (-) Transcript_31572:1688-1945(-)